MYNQDMKILIIEDTQELATNLVRYLSIKNISSEIALLWNEGLHKAVTKYYDAIILDINLPDINGLDICKKLREKEKDIPIIMLTSRGTKWDVITGLEAWADDYLVKPFDYDILVARLEALTRRNLKNKSTVKISIPGYEIDLKSMEVVSKSGEQVHLSQLEFSLLKYFAQNKNRALDRKELYEKVWGEFDGDFMFSKTVDVYIWYLRKKLGREIVVTKKWFGYIMTNNG